MADNGPPNPRHHAKIPLTDCPTSVPHLDGAGGSAAFIPAAKNQVIQFFMYYPLQQ